MKEIASNTVRMATPGQIKDINALLIQAVPEITFEVADQILGDKSVFIGQVRNLFPKPEEISDPVKSWERFYKKYFGITVDFSALVLPPKREGFDRLIIVAEGLTLNQVSDVCAKAFPCWRYADDLNEAVPTNDRDPKNGAYAIWIRDRVEADEELKNLSADTLTERNIKGITLLERMLFELKYFSETKKHLDTGNWTLCNGSRNSDGDVPSARWLDGKFWVYYSSSDYHCPGLRSRKAVSL